jgi:hypothetical protein
VSILTPLDSTVNSTAQAVAHAGAAAEHGGAAVHGGAWFDTPSGLSSPQSGQGLVSLKQSFKTTSYRDDSRLQLSLNTPRGKGKGLEKPAPVFAMYDKEGKLVVLDPVKVRISRLRKRVWNWADCLKMSGILGNGKYRVVMVTLTYRDVGQWRKRHIRDFMLSMRKVLKGRLLAYAWVAELQERGAVHYHVLFVVRRGVLLPQPDTFWKHGSTKIETARTVFYVMKYAQKGSIDGLQFPKGLRLFAVWISAAAVRGGAVDAKLFLRFKLSCLPRWLAGFLDEWGFLDSKRVRSPGGGWLINGFMLVKSPFKVFCIA